LGEKKRLISPAVILHLHPGNLFHAWTLVVPLMKNAILGCQFSVITQCKLWSTA